MDLSTTFENIYFHYINRNGAKELFDWLKSTDFFIAPASTKYHAAYQGGLCEHSINVFNKLKALVEMERNNKNPLVNGITDESIAIVSLLHDLCKIDFYTVETRNVKNQFGMWEKVPYYAINEKFSMGHGEKSVYLILKHMKLTDNEALAINWHMGAFDKRVIGGDYSISNAFENCPLAVLLHTADFLSTYLIESR